MPSAAVVIGALRAKGFVLLSIFLSELEEDLIVSVFLSEAGYRCCSKAPLCI